MRTLKTDFARLRTMVGPYLVGALFVIVLVVRPGAPL